MLEDSRHDDIANILEEVLLEYRLSILIITEILEEFLHCLGERFVLWILVELISKEFSLINDAVRVVSVSFAKEILSLVIQLIAFLVGLVLKDVALLFQTFADVLVYGLEPILQIWITVGINGDVLDGFKEIFGAGRVGKTFDQSLEFGQRFFVCSDET